MLSFHASACYIRILASSVDIFRTTVRSVDAAVQKRFLLILQGSGVTSLPLPNQGEIKIGRADDCDVSIDDESVSRYHASLKLQGSQITIADLGSANGSWIGDERLPANEGFPIVINQMVSLGEAIIIVQQRRAELVTRRVWGHDYFEGRVAEQCEQSARDGAGRYFAVLRLRIGSGQARIHSLFATMCQERDTIGSYGPNEYEILVESLGQLDIEDVVREWERAAERLSITLTMGYSVFPLDGCRGDLLLSKARPGGDKAKPAAPVIVDEAMVRLYELLDRLGPAEISVLMYGETGVGKQVLVERLHASSGRTGPLVEVNCAAIPENLFESVLFGHKKGSFTGAESDHVGLIQSAHKGTFFLDELGELPLALQSKLLRIIETKTVSRIGEAIEHDVDVRFVSATNRDLSAKVDEGKFRGDLYFRIAAVTVDVPPLRERVGEIVALAERFAAEFAPSEVPQFTQAARNSMQMYPWPGNVRELRNVVERAVVFAEDGRIDADILGLTSASTAPSVEAATAATDERSRILNAQLLAGGNVTEAAKILGVSRRTLSRWLDKYDLPRPRKERSGEAS